MSLLLRGKRPWRFFFQLKQNINIPSILRNGPANLGLQKGRALCPPCDAVHGSFFSPCTATRFSTAAEAVSMASEDTAVALEPRDSTVDCVTSKSAKAMASVPEQEEGVLKKVVEEHTQLFTVLQAKLENQRISINSALEEIRALKAQQEAEVVEASKSPIKLRQPLLEWTAFIEYLQSAGFFKGEVKSSNSDTVLEDPACVKKAIYRFSQAQGIIYGSLSQMDLRILARYGSAGNDSKAAASQGKLRQFFQAEDEVSNLNAAKPASPQPKLADVTRLIYSTISVIQEGVSASDAKFSISHLLREMITLSSQSKGSAALLHEVISAPPIRASDLLGSPRREKEKPEKGEKKQDLLKVKAGKIEKSSGRDATREATSKPKQWKCPRCLFVNPDSKNRCVECSRRRPQSTCAGSTVINAKEESSDDELLGLLDDEKPKRAHRSSKKDSPSKMQEVKSSRAKSLVEEHEDTDMEASDTESDLGSEETKGGGNSDDDVDILDDILNSEGSEDESQGRGRRGSLSDVSDDEPKGDGKKARLCKLVPKQPGAPAKRGGLGGKAQRWPPRKGKRHDDVVDDDDDDEEEGYASLEDDKPNKRGDRSEGRRGFGLRGSGGSRGDFYNDRRGSWGHGDKDRDHVDRDRGYGGRDMSSRGLRGRSRY